MATILDELVSRVEDPDLRAQIAEQVARVQSTREYGLVFPAHLPERVRLPNHPVRRRTVVTLRDGSSKQTWVVKRVAKGTAYLVGEDGEESSVPVDDLVVVRRFGEPVFPGLRSVGKVCNGGEAPFHLALNSENYHALEALLYAYEGAVDCVYIDPPYNTGAKDWKYNNDFVDSNDSYRHSKWLSFMERRLRMTRRLLKDDSVLVVTIDEHEVTRLGVLLEQMFPEADVTLVTIVINPKGVGSTRFSRVEEYAYFCFFGSAAVGRIKDDLLTVGGDLLDQDDEVEVRRPRWNGLLRAGNNARRVDRKKMFYPVLIDEAAGAARGVGDSLPFDQEPDFDTKIDGLTPVWPVRSDGSLGNWGVGAASLRQLIEQGFVKVGGKDDARRTWSLSYVSKASREQLAAGVLVVQSTDPVTGVHDLVYADPMSDAGRIKTVWHRTRHDAGVGGSSVVRDLVGAKVFTFPKSIYAVRDTLAMLVGNNPNALVLDFFAGSGTTAHACAMLNAEDGGSRQCIVVTNNEVGAESQAELTSQGLMPGDPDWEAEGIFNKVTRPRLEAAITGKRSDGSAVPAKLTNADGSKMSAGLAANIEFFELTYLDRTDVERGQAFAAIAPLLWMEAGAKGERIDEEAKDYAISESSGYAVLFDVGAWSGLAAQLDTTDTIKYVFIVTDSLAQYQQIVAELPPDVRTRQLYSDYLANFELNTGGAA